MDGLEGMFRGMNSDSQAGVEAVVVAPRRASVTRQVLVLVLKLSLAAAVLWFVLRQTDVEALRTALAGAAVPLLCLGLALNVTTVLIAGLRWKLLVRALGIGMRWRDLTCIAFIGQFFATFLPGPLGDDVTRMFYIARAAGDRAPLALSSVVVDRVIGLAVILLLALAVTPWHYAVLASNPQTAVFATGIVAGGAAVLSGLTVFFLLPRARLHALGLRMMHRIPEGKWRVQAGRFAGAYFDHRRVLAQVMAAALATQLILCLIFWLGGRAVGIELGPIAWLGFVPVVLAANAVPITIAGLGIREYLVVLFLGVVGSVGSGEAMAASLAVFSMMLATNLLGGAVYLAYHLSGRSKQPPLSPSFPTEK